MNFRVNNMSIVNRILRPFNRVYLNSSDLLTNKTPDEKREKYVSITLFGYRKENDNHPDYYIDIQKLVDTINYKKLVSKNSLDDLSNMYLDDKEYSNSIIIIDSNHLKRMKKDDEFFNTAWEIKNTFIPVPVNKESGGLKTAYVIKFSKPITGKFLNIKKDLEVLRVQIDDDMDARLATVRSQKYTLTVPPFFNEKYIMTCNSVKKSKLDSDPVYRKKVESKPKKLEMKLKQPENWENGFGSIEPQRFHYFISPPLENETFDEYYERYSSIFKKVLSILDNGERNSLFIDSRLNLLYNRQNKFIKKSFESYHDIILDKLKLEYDYRYRRNRRGFYIGVECPVELAPFYMEKAEKTAQQL